MLMCFKEKWSDRYVYGENVDVICAKVLKERIGETLGYGRSIWYEEDTENAIKTLNDGRAKEYMYSRRSFEYEDFEEVDCSYASVEEDYIFYGM